MRDNVLTKFVARFVLAFAVLTALWIWLAPFYNTLVFSIANMVLQTEDPVVAALGQQQSQWTAYMVNGSAQEAVIEFDTHGTFFNVVLLLGLLLATPKLSAVGRVWRSLAALMVLGAVQVVFVSVQIKAQFINYGLLGASGQSAYEFNWLAVFLGTMGEQLLPLLIVAALTWKAWFAALSNLFQRKPQAKNEFCACGSGKKFKVCCAKKMQPNPLIPPSGLKLKS